MITLTLKRLLPPRSAARKFKNMQARRPARLSGFLVMLGALCLPTASAIAESAEDKGFAIAARSDRSDRGFGNSEQTATMILRNAQGQESKRVLFQRVLEVPDENLGDKSIIVFESPADVDGTALLSHAQIIDPDDQWLYLPALKRVKRISSKNKSGPFVGSEFAFEDFTSQELNKYTYKYMKSEPCPNVPSLTCDVLERYPAYEFSGYTKQVSWIDQTDHQIRQIDYYDRKNELLKTLRFGKYKQYKGKYWRALELKMENHLNGKSTDFLFSDYKFGLDLSDNDFEKGVLRRVR